MADQTVKEVAKIAQPAINDAVHSLMSWAQQITDFGKEQAPLLAQEIIRWGVVSNLFGAIIGVVILVTMGVVLCKKVIPWIKNAESSYDRENRTIPTVIFGTIFSGLGLALFIRCTFDVIKAVVAPRLYLIEYLAHLIK